MSLSRLELDATVAFLNRGSYVQFVSGAPIYLVYVQAATNNRATAHLVVGSGSSSS